MNNIYQDWSKYWTETSKNLYQGWQNPANQFTQNHTPDAFQLFNNNIQNMFSVFNMPNAQGFSTPNPTDILSMVNSFQNFDFNKLNIEQLFNHPIFKDLELAIKHNDTQKQREILASISDYWCEKANFLMLKNIDILKWQKEWLSISLKRTEITHFENETSKEIRDSLLTFNNVYGSFIQLMENFKGFDQQLAQIFAEKAMSDEFKIKDMSELFDVWTQSFENLYKEFTFSEDYQQAYGDLVNAITEVKVLFQKVIDKNVESFGLPSNREMDSVHLRINKLSKQLRKLQNSANPEVNQAQSKHEEQHKSVQKDIDLIQKRIEKLADKIKTQELNLKDKDTQIKMLEKRISTITSAKSAKKAPTKTSK